MLVVPELPEEIRALKERARAFVETEVYPLEQQIARAGTIDPGEIDELRRRSAEARFAMLNMPYEAGGRDLSMLGQVALEEEAGRCTNGLGFVVANRGPRELYEMATAEQVERFLAPVLRGEYHGAWAITEPGAGSDVSDIQTTAVRDGDDWLLTGEKWFVTSQGEPGYYVVLALAEGEQALFFVEPDAPGLRIKFTPGFLHDPYLDHHPEILFEGCRVPERNRIPSGGNEGAKEWFTIERLFIAARCCGAAARSLELASDYAKERVQFGQPIVEFQGVSFQLADCLTELLAARLMTYHAAHAFDVEENRKIVHGKVAMAKLYASEMAGRVVDRSLQVFGGRGYRTDNPVARLYREVRVDRIWEGTSEIQRLVIARGLVKRGVDPYAA
ncbi:MAG: acyl-CoA dehydrogenase [Thermoleophilia bacterium]|nr:acyl-CoA dehydrogenase [Thermoleophilia bacterium]